MASTLVDLSEEQSEFVGKLLEQLEKALKEFDRRTRNMPSEIAQQAAQKVVQSIADSVSHKVADALRSAEAELQRLLRDINNAAAEYKRASILDETWRVVLIACVSGVVSGLVAAGLLLVLAKMGIV